MIIPYYDGVGFIGRAVDSLVAQTHPIVEVVIVDDCSPTAVPASVIEVLHNGEMTWKIVNNGRNLGTAASRNVGAQSATFPILTFLDQDDQLEPTAIAEIADGVGERRAFAFDNYICERTMQDELCPLNTTVFNESKWVPRRIMPDDYRVFFSPGFPMLKLGVGANDFHRMGGYPAHIYGMEDFLFAWRLVTSGVSVEFSNEALGTYIRSSDSTSHLIASTPTGQIRARQSWVWVWREISFYPSLTLTFRLLALRNLFISLLKLARCFAIGHSRNIISWLSRISG